MQVFRETLRASQEKARQYAEESAQRVKKERLNFQVRKKNLTELNTTKSKLNYLSKINEEMQAIKEYQVRTIQCRKWSKWQNKTPNTCNNWKEGTLPIERKRRRTRGSSLNSRAHTLAVFTDPLSFLSNFSYLIHSIIQKNAMNAQLLSVTPACLLEGDHSPSYLDALFDLAKLQAQFLLANQGAELGLIIKDEVIVAIFANSRVVAGDGDVGDPNFALMPAADSDAICRNILDHHHVVGLV